MDKGAGKASLTHGTEYWVVSANAGAILVVLLFGVAHIVEFRGRRQHAASEPHSVSLHMVRNDVHCQRHGFDPSTAEFLATLDAEVHESLDISLQAFAEVLEHSGSSRQHNVLVQTTTSIDGAGLDGVIHHFGKRCQEITAHDLRIEEDLGTQETLISHITNEWLLGDALDALVLFDPLVSFSIVFLEFLGKVGTHIAQCLLHSLRHLERLGRGNVCLTLTHKLLNECCDVSAGNGDVLDR